MNEFSPSDEELLSRLSWFVRLRWLFLLALTALLFFATEFFHLDMQLKPIAAVAFVVLAYNLVFFFLHYIRALGGVKPTSKALRVEAHLQIGLDLASMVGLVHFSGGIENPFIFFFIFHMIIGSILLTGREIWFHAVWTIVLLMLGLFLSYFGLLSHYHIVGFASDELWGNVPYMLAGSIAFAATIVMTVYMTNSISRSVHRRENELRQANTQLEKKSEELEFVNRELIRQQTLLIQSEKLASLGKLSAGIAHELNNPLTGIINFAHFIKDYSPDHEQLQYDIGVLIRETKRCKKIIKGLLDYARQSEPEKKEEDVIKLLNRAITLVKNHKDFRDIEIIEDFDENLPKFMFDHDQIQQVFMNLIVNAQEAMHSNGVLYIRAKLDHKENCVEIRFQDNGPGISEECMMKIFDPFFTTKEMGTGLGLSISMGIVQSHHGKLLVESAPGKGCTFIVKLPVGNNQGELP